MKNILQPLFVGLLLLLAGHLSASAAKTLVTEQVTSPDGNYLFTFTQEDEGGVSKMYYTLTFKGQTITEKSLLGVEIENKLFENALGVPNDNCRHWMDNLVYTGTERAGRDTTWTPVYGEWATIRDHYNQLTVKFRKGKAEEKLTNGYNKERTYYMNLEVRAYDEGVALRYHFPMTSNGLFIHITGEQTEFSMPEGTKAYYEEWAQGPFSFLPLKDWEGESERPLTMKLPSGLSVALLEARLVDYSRTKFALSKEKPSTLVTSMYDCADIMTPYSTPWRLIMAAERSVDLINNNYVVLNLNDESKLKDTSWIRPGKAFRCNLTQEDGMKGIDFAAERGLQYVEFDAGWYGPEYMMSSDASRVVEGKNLDFPALCKYAASKGIGVFVYVNQRALYQQLDQILPIYKQWGIKGIKFGFVQVGNQQWTTWVHDAVKKCAQYGILVDIHDEYRPTGVSRTWPNLMTQEGIAGNEEMPDATHNTILPFTRFLAGAADYTLCYFNNRVKNTKAHQLAMAAVYYSPIQFMYWYDKPSLYQGEQELDFWKAVPAVWDETRALQGEPGEYIATARRTGTDWYLGIMTNTEGRTVTLQTDFLEKGKKYTARIYEDDPTLKTRTNVRTTVKTIKGGQQLSFKLLPSGGAAVQFVPRQ